MATVMAVYCHLLVIVYPDAAGWASCAGNQLLLGGRSF